MLKPGRQPGSQAAVFYAFVTYGALLKRYLARFFSEQYDLDGRTYFASLRYSI